MEYINTFTNVSTCTCIMKPAYFAFENVNINKQTFDIIVDGFKKLEFLIVVLSLYTIGF